MKKTIWVILILLAAWSHVSCRATLSSGLDNDTVQLPFMKNSSNECYYLDEFMPIPDGMVTGKTGTLNLRYYSYKTATYKEIKNAALNLAFYSLDNRCWSLFEEYYSIN